MIRAARVVAGACLAATAIAGGLLFVGAVWAGSVIDGWGR